MVQRDQIKLPSKMYIPSEISGAFGQSFEALLTKTTESLDLLRFSGADRYGKDSPFSAEGVYSKRFLRRSIAPHIKRLSESFNHTAKDLRPNEIQNTWTSSSNTSNLLLSYLLGFFPGNVVRMAAVWSELSRLGYHWPANAAPKAIDLGSGPSASACGISMAEALSPTGLPDNFEFQMVDKNSKLLKIGTTLTRQYFNQNGHPNWKGVSTKSNINYENLIPSHLSGFGLWTMSYFLNESEYEPKNIARSFIKAAEESLSEEALIIIIEPALKPLARKLLEVRKELIKVSPPWLNVLLPCLGHQACGALEKSDDWCHEGIKWKRPPYLEHLDELCGLDHRQLHFSYLVLAKSKRPVQEILPKPFVHTTEIDRLVSPLHGVRKTFEYYLCGKKGKRKVKFAKREIPKDLIRGDLVAEEGKKKAIY